MINDWIEIEIESVRMRAYASGALFLLDANTLVVADLHIGKAEHFRQNGFALPTGVNDGNFKKLAVLFDELKPSKVVFLGDIIHSVENAEWTAFIDFMSSYSEIEQLLVRGNHDKQPADFFERHGIEVVDDWLIEGILFSHEPLEDLPLYNISGHIHPSVMLNGLARQSMRLPCFYFTKKSGLLPAFGSFTGSATIRPKTGDLVLVLLEEKISDLSSRISSPR